MWIDDHPSIREYNPTFDRIRREQGRSTNAPSRLRGIRGVRKEWVNHETVQHESSRAQQQAVNKLASN